MDMKDVVNSFKSRRILAGLITGSLLLGLNHDASAQTTAPIPVEKKKWESSAAAGLTLTRGNSSTIVGNASVLSARKWEQDEASLGASGTYGKNSGIKNAENAQAFGQFNHLFNPRLYAGVRLDLFHDAIAAIDYRGTLSPLLGYYFVKNENTRLSGEAGPSFIYQKQGGQTRGYVAARVGERLEQKLSATAKLWQSLEFLPQVDRLEKYLINGEIGVEAALSKHMSLRSYVQDNYDHRPAAGRQKNDVRFVTAVAYKF